MVFNWLKNLKKGLTKSSTKISDGLKTILVKKKIDDDTLSEIEELLISSDVGVLFASEIVNNLKRSKLSDVSLVSVKENINKSINKILKPLESKIELNCKPKVLLVVGVNGTGKTATVGKLAHKFVKLNKKVGVVAADTFRDAAVEQLKIWSERSQCIFFSGKADSDPAALVYSSYHKAKETNIDLLLIDTAGRLHNKSNLMDELSKIIRVIKKLDEKSLYEIILVLDGNTGQNSIKQAEKFNDICELNSLVITKLDGTSKGGSLIPIAKSLKIPILAVGVGESKEDLIDFNANEFSKALLDFE